jgi:hypothetical protein
MIWGQVGLVLGILIGLNLHDDKTKKTVEQVDADMRKDLERYRNLSASLLEDVKYWRDRFNTLQKAKETK